MTREEARAIYEAKCDQADAVCNAARAAATRAYSQEVKEIDRLTIKRHTRGEAGREAQRQNTEAVLKAYNRCEAALNKAEHVHYVTRMQAWKEMKLALEGKDVPARTEQLALWEAR